MKTTVEYLDQVKAERGLPSDYALAKLLGLTHTSIIQYRNGRAALGIETSMKVGEILGVDGHAVYADGQIERAKNAQVLEFWKTVSEKFSESFKTLLLGASPRRDCVSTC
jgi:DNA-binding XRE family transcriptional regulator